MSNRILLNRLAVTGQHEAEVLLAVAPSRFDAIAAMVDRLGGRVRRSEASIAYLRVEIPLERLVELVSDPGVVTYQISSLSKGSWYRDGPPRSNAEMYRRYEVTPVIPAPTIPAARADLPILSPAEARASGYTADDDIGIGAWMAEHPTYDGRGVTIALLETGLIQFTEPSLQTAKAVDGRNVPKIAGIFNALDPDKPDDTRLDLDVELHATSTWCRVGARTYIVPGPGTYRFGVFSLIVGDNLVQHFGVLRDQATGEIRVDTNGDADFSDEPPIPDVNTRFEPRTLRLTHPRRFDLAFVVSAGRRPNQVHVYVARSGHATMTASVAAGSNVPDSIASGVAPGARLLLVRHATGDYRMAEMFESYLDVIRRPDVDILCDSSGFLFVPDTSADFAAVFFTRLIETFRKPIVRPAGNASQILANAQAFGAALTVGGSISVATFSALFGGATIPQVMVHPMSAGGPGIDGALKPDVIAPMHRISAGVYSTDLNVTLPQNAPLHRLPAGYGISCCTSAASPYAAGVTALLISGAKQEQLAYSVETLGRALRISARFLDGWPAHLQGNGLLDVAAAWHELHRVVETPRIRGTAANVHALAPYGAAGITGVGLFEREGWTSGAHGVRMLRLRRESGTPAAVAYRLSWAGNDGTFETVPSITLPLNTTAPVPIEISIGSPGAHSAILNLHEPATDAIVFRVAATIVAAEPLDMDSHTVHLRGTVGIMRTATRFLTVPDRVTAMRLQLDVGRGSLTTLVLPSHGIVREYYGHVFPQHITFGKGSFSVVLPSPAPGTWAIKLSNDAAWRSRTPDPGAFAEADYSISIQFLTVSVEPRWASTRELTLDMINRASAIEEPAIDVSTGLLRTHRAELLPNGLPNQFAIDVPAGATTLMWRVRADDQATPLELHTYDCTTGQCFSYDFTVPAANAQTIVVRKPSAGRWIAAVNPAPLAVGEGRFTVDEIVTGPSTRHPDPDGSRRLPGAKWTQRVAAPQLQIDVADATRVVVCELIDVAAERHARNNPWANRSELTNLGESSVAAGMGIVAFK